MVKEINAHVEKKYWVLINCNKVPTNIYVIPAVWSMHRKHNLTTKIVTNEKSYGMNYYKTYAPVVMWYAVCLVAIISTLFNLALRQIDFVLAYI